MPQPTNAQLLEVILNIGKEVTECSTTLKTVVTTQEKHSISIQALVIDKTQRDTCTETEEKIEAKQNRRKSDRWSLLANIATSFGGGLTMVGLWEFFTKKGP